ncbi:MAG: hypothetical protein JXR37_15550 [Kiritimatiellae bacterium]|nr:hypothetical protein [Kiritimatiellia bacterium]
MPENENSSKTPPPAESPDSRGKARKPPANDAGGDATLMYVVCCRCHKFLEVRPGPIEAMTHTYCEDCYKAMMTEIDDVLKKKEGGTEQGGQPRTG